MCLYIIWSCCKNAFLFNDIHVLPLNLELFVRKLCIIAEQQIRPLFFSIVWLPKNNTQRFIPSTCSPLFCGYLQWKMKLFRITIGPDPCISSFVALLPLCLLSVVRSLEQTNENKVKCVRRRESSTAKWAKENSPKSNVKQWMALTDLKASSIVHIGKNGEQAHPSVCKCPHTSNIRIVVVWLTLKLG